VIKSADCMRSIAGFDNLVINKGEKVVLTESLMLVQRLNNFINICLLPIELDGFREIICVGRFDKHGLGINLRENVFA